MGFRVSQTRFNKILDTIRLVAFTNGRTVANLADAWVATKHCSLHVNRVFAGKRGTFPAKDHAFFERQMDSLRIQNLCYHFGLAENDAHGLHMLSEVLNRTARFQATLAKLENALTEEEAMVGDLEYPLHRLMAQGKGKGEGEGVGGAGEGTGVEAGAGEAGVGRYVETLKVLLQLHDAQQAFTINLADDIFVYTLSPTRPEGAKNAGATSDATSDAMSDGARRVGVLREVRLGRAGADVCRVFFGDAMMEESVPLGELGLFDMNVSDFGVYNKQCSEVGREMQSYFHFVRDADDVDVSVLSSLRPFAQHVWVDWSAFVGGLRGVYADLVSRAAAAMDDAILAFARCKLKVYSLEMRALEIKWVPLVHIPQAQIAHMGAETTSSYRQAFTHDVRTLSGAVVGLSEIRETHQTLNDDIRTQIARSVASAKTLLKHLETCGRRLNA